MSVGDILLDARMVKACRRFGKWEALNCEKKRLELFSKMNTGLEVVPRPGSIPRETMINSPR